MAHRPRCQHIAHHRDEKDGGEGGPLQTTLVSGFEPFRHHPNGGNGFKDGAEAPQKRQRRVDGACGVTEQLHAKRGEQQQGNWEGGHECMAHRVAHVGRHRVWMRTETHHTQHAQGDKNQRSEHGADQAQAERLFTQHIGRTQPCLGQTAPAHHQDEPSRAEMFKRCHGARCKAA